MIRRDVRVIVVVLRVQAKGGLIAIAAIVVPLHRHLVLLIWHQATLIMLTILLYDVCQVHVCGVLHILNIADVIQIVLEVSLTDLRL